MLGRTLELAEKYKANITGALTWAFEFEDQPYFDGFRTLATNGIGKPVLNLFRMLGLMSGDQVRVASSGAVALDSILTSGVSDRPDVSGFGTRQDRELSVLVWNYHDDLLQARDASVELTIERTCPAPPGAFSSATIALMSIIAMPTRRGRNWGRLNNPTPGSTHSSSHTAASSN